MSYAAFISDLHISSPFFRKKEFLDFAEWLGSTKIKYLMICGDLCNSQSGIDDVKEMLAKIPKNIIVYAIPGNHDPVPETVPQPAMKKIDTLPNVVFLPNPSYIELEGKTILMYHGQGMEYIRLPTIEKMCYMIETKTIVPQILPMEKTPDIFHTGHIHVYVVGTYKDTLMINAGSWMQKNMFVENENICRAVVVDLETLEYKTYSPTDNGNYI